LFNVTASGTHSYPCVFKV